MGKVLGTSLSIAHLSWASGLLDGCPGRSRVLHESLGLSQCRHISSWMKCWGAGSSWMLTRRVSQPLSASCLCKRLAARRSSPEAALSFHLAARALVQLRSPSCHRCEQFRQGRRLWLFERGRLHDGVSIYAFRDLHSSPPPSAEPSPVKGGGHQLYMPLASDRSSLLVASGGTVTRTSCANNVQQWTCVCLVLRHLTQAAHSGMANSHDIYTFSCPQCFFIYLCRHARIGPGNAEA